MYEVVKKIDFVKQKLSNCEGRSFNFHINKGRNNFIDFEGTIKKIYPSIFLIEDNQSKQEYTYSYNDIITKKVVFLSNKQKNVN